MSLLGKIFRKVTPRAIGTALTNFKILQIDYGQLRTVCRWTCVDAQNKPIPWYTYPAIDYLKQLNFSDKKVFEYGSGNSSFFWADRAKEVISIEHNPSWFKSISKHCPNNLNILLLEDKEDYISAIEKHADLDVIIIDGLYRKECALKAIAKLKEGGLIILDNSDWHVYTAQALRDADLIQVDMTGFGPINFYTWTTSLFISRKFAVRPCNNVQPLHGPGSLKKHVDAD
ncbi:MAG: hypothetical protein ACTS2F_08550 [Thainema sp.]